ncbi:MAG: glycogen synthase GlgA [Candidatus Polarisedimenticolaceae bacterium]|nr:glycogen synthase GlgA [Candidatus Polarisedimenticolaceae bacterium]
MSTNSKLNILFAASEAAPLIKTGGLADVAGSLPAALRELGHDVRLILPAYPQTIDKLGKVSTAATLKMGGHQQPIRILRGTLDNGVPCYLVDAPEYFSRQGNPYLSPNGHEWGDNAERFALFSRAIIAIGQNRSQLKWQPDVIHCNDWQTGLVAPLLSTEPGRPATIFTIHNLAYQGLFDQSTFNRLELPEELWTLHGLEFHDQLSYIKGGIVYADRVNTVSPTYAKELLTAEFGYGLEGLLSHRTDHFSGIINGIDYQEWDPNNDSRIPHHYDHHSFQLKQLNKQALQRAFGLPDKPDALLFGYIGRLVAQKGVDLILQVIPGIIDRGGQVIMLGSGEAELEQAMEEVHQRFPKQTGLFIGYDEDRAHQVEAGCDAFLMPSRFEPCGLNQIYSLRYGTVPIVRHTGGLADTVIDVTPETLTNGTATGFHFNKATGTALWGAVERALDFYQHSRSHWERLAITGMQQDLSWASSAEHYQALYIKALSDLET